MEVRSLGKGVEVEIDVRPTDHGYMIIHKQRGKGDKGTYTVTCCCDGKGCVSRSCSYPDGTPPSPTCDCTGSSPRVSC